MVWSPKLYDIVNLGVVLINKLFCNL